MLYTFKKLNIILCAMLSGVLPFCVLCTQNIETPLNKLSFSDNSAVLPEKHPSVIIFTNRKESLPASEYGYFGNEIDPSGALHYMSIYCENNACEIHPHDTFDEALAQLDLSKDILVFVHGDGKMFRQSIERGIRLKSLYDVNVIAFDWPSKDPTRFNGATNYYNSRHNARLSVKQFGFFIEHINEYLKKRKTGLKSVNILFHSMGALILQRYIEFGDPQSISAPVFDNLILDAAAVKQSKHAAWLNRIKIQKKTYVIMNDNDFTLHGASILTFGTMLGLGTDGPYADNAVYIDYSDILEYEHNYCVMDANQLGTKIRSVYDAIIHGDSPDLNNRELFKKENDAPVYKLIR